MNTKDVGVSNNDDNNDNDYDEEMTKKQSNVKVDFLMIDLTDINNKFLHHFWINR
tara:strand:+ start:152 stop:316 length:165 start_codon:yes stop_codon:yes gene_type:complete